jgi:gliding motility-associated-like protein
MGEPVIICPGDQTSYLDDQWEFSIPNYTTHASVEGHCGEDPVFTQIPDSGTQISGSGPHEIIINAMFQDSTSTDCSFNLVLLDTIRPSLSSSIDTTILLGEGIYKMIVSMPVPAFTDNCGVQTIFNDFNGGKDASGEFTFGTTVVVYTVTDSSGNQARFTQQLTLSSIPEPAFGLVIPEGFSPNEDGLNDRFEILGLEQYPDNELRIFNVHGNEVYQMTGYDNSWDGTSASNLNKGGRLPTGTYYYALYLGVENAIMKGFVYLRRE